jgi:hypothetical protein
MNSVKKVYWALALASLAACGPQQKAATPTPIDSQQSQASSSEPNSMMTVLETLIEPTSPEGPWSRKLKVSGPLTDHRVIVEGRSAEQDPWDHLGVTNEAGVYIDQTIAKSRQYRFGEVYVSPMLPAISDANLDSAPATSLVKAFRIVVRSRILLGPNNYSFEALQIKFEPGAKFVAFEPGSVGSQSAGTILMRANQFKGSLLVDLRGQNGSSGIGGANGRNGRNGGRGEVGENGKNGTAGTPGQRGGNGGSLIVECSNPSAIALSEVVIAGGLGGAGGHGGAGGKGGKGGHEWRSSLGRHGVDPEPPTYKPDGHSGSAGRTGATGSSGLPGAVVVNQLVVPTGFERYAKSYVAPLELTEQR